MNCNIQLLDGSTKQFPSLPTGLELAASIHPQLARKSVGVLINDEKEIQDIRTVLKDGDKVEIITLNPRDIKKSLEIIRHSAAHVLAQAVQSLWPEVKVTIGPVIDNGFYYDFDTDKKFTPEDLLLIEKEIRKILKEKQPITKEVWPKQKALDYFKSIKEELKQEIIEDLGVPEVSIYKQGDWLDLCRGPHVQHVGQIGVIKLLSISGAYWRGDTNNKSLQRIYGTAFHSQKDLNEFLKKREEAKANDHRILGKKLDLFWFSELSPASPFFTADGTIVYHLLQNFLRKKYQEYEYEEVITPQIYREDLFQKSGHSTHYKANMYAIPQEDTTLYLKPMNCPGHCLLYKKDKKSYRDLPWRVADFGRLHRNEATGALQGLTRVRSFCQDDAHIFCRPDQLSEEIKNGVKMLEDVYQTLGLKNYEIFLSTRPEKRMGDDKLWDQAEDALRQALVSLKIPFEENPGDGAFYGPKLDICVKDSFDRSWQLGTFQCDFNLPEAFDLSYINDKDQDNRPVMIHRALLGSLERFIGVYLEHRRGRLPLWLCPSQAIILPLTEKENSFCEQMQKKLAQKEIICKIDLRNEKLSYKIRQAQEAQIPYMIVIGKKEIESNTLSVRLRDGTMVQDLSLESFQNSILEEIQNKSLTPQIKVIKVKQSN